MSINDSGFLGPQIESISSDILKKHQAAFDLCFETNRVAQKLKYSFSSPFDDLQRVMATCLFARVLNGFQATVISSKYGLSVEARIIVRTILEAFFYLEQVCKDETFADKFATDSEARRLSHINYILRERPDLLSPQIKQALEKQKAELLARGISSASKLNLPKIMGRMYAAYRSLSDKVHPTAWSVQQYIQATEDPSRSLVEWGPSNDELEQTLALGCHILIQSLKHMCVLFAVEASSSTLDAAFDSLQVNINDYYTI